MTEQDASKTQTFIHFCGLSAVGKKSLIKKLLHPEGMYLRDHFWITGTVESYGPKFLRNEVDTPNGKSYIDFLLEGLLESNADTVIHQWQWAHESLVADLYRLKPKAAHKAYLMWRPWNDHRLEIFLHRPPWQPTIGELEWQWHQLLILGNMWQDMGIEVCLLNGRTYEIQRQIPDLRGGT